MPGDMTPATVPLKRFPLFQYLSLLLLAFATGCSSAPPGWMKVGGPLYNIGGMAYAGEDAVRGGGQFLVVHDNKKPDEPHVGLVTLRRGKTRYQKIPRPAGGAPAPADPGSG